MKNGRFLVKAAAASALVALLGAGAALVALKALFPEPKIRAWIVDSARRQLGRDVRLERLGLGPRGLVLRGLEVSERPDFASGTFLRVESFRLRPSWRALLKRRFVVAAVSADGLTVRVVKGADGRFNYETLASSAPAGAAAAALPRKAPTSDAPPAPELDVRRAVVTGGTVEYVDAPAGVSWTLDDVKLDVADFSQAAPFGVTASFRARGKAGERAVDARAAFDGEIDLARGARAKFKTDVKRLVVEQQGLELEASGTILGLDAPRIAFDAALTAAGVRALKAAGELRLGDGVDADLKASTPGLRAAWLAELAPGSGLPALDVPAMDLSLAGTFTSDRAELKTFRAAWDGGRIEGSGAARGLKKASPSYEGQAAFGLDVPALSPGQYPFLRLPAKLSLPASRLDGAITLGADGDLKISMLTAKLKQGSLSASGTIRRAGSSKPLPDVDVTGVLALPAFQLSELPFAVSGLRPSFQVPAGRLAGGVRFSGDDVRLEKLSFLTKGASVIVDGVVAKALAGDATPDLTASANLALPELSDKDLPFPGAPAGLRLPPSHWTAEAAYSARLLRVKSLRLLIGKNDLEVSGTVADPGGRSAYDLLVKCRSFALDELTQLTPKTRDEKLSGTGFFAFAMTGAKDKPEYAGKAQFKGLGATLAGLPLSDFSGTVSFDPKRVDAPDLTGKVADGALKMDLTVKDYAAAPEVQLDASLDRFDLGRYLAAKEKFTAERDAARAAKAAPPAQASHASSSGKPPAPLPAEKPTPVVTRGHIEIGTLLHPNAEVTGVKVSWDLRGVAPDLHGLNGEAQLQVGGGKLSQLGDMAAGSKLVKILIFPLLVVQKIGRVGGIRLFPDFNDMTLNGIDGDYGFKNGVMTLRRSEIHSSAAQVLAKGTIDLPAEALDLTFIADIGLAIPIDVTGSFDKPQYKVHIAKSLAEPAAQLIQSFLKK